MQYSQRLDQRLHMLRAEVRTMTQEKEQGERVWRDRLQRCQRQLKAKEDEMSRQSQYFENFKTQLQHKLSTARDREQSLQNRIYTLEKQLLEMTVSAATGMATIGAVRITAGTAKPWEEQERLPSMRGEGEGEEARKEERRKQWQPSVGAEGEGGKDNEGKTEEDIQGGRVKDTGQKSNEARLQGFILSLQEDLRVLLEREEDGMTERRGLMEQLQAAQENSHFLGCKVEDMKAEVQQLKLSEGSLMEEAEELREENRNLQQMLTDAANQTHSQSPTCLAPGTISPSCSPAVCPVPSNTLPCNAVDHSSVWSSGEVHLTSDEATDQPHASAVLPVHHQASAESTQINKEDHSSSAKSESPPNNGPLSRFHHPGSNPIRQSLPFATETLDEFKLGTWCSRGMLNLEQSPSEESDALRDAYRSLGLGEDLEALQEHRDRLEVALQHMQEQLQMMAQENTRLKLQLRKEVEEEPGSVREKDDLVQALNQENRALANRIQELLAHIELREEEMKREEKQLRERFSNLEVNGDRLKQENQEHECLITELTKKTEDDLNTIMELQQKLSEAEKHMEETQADKEPCGSGRFQQNNLEECVDSLVESVLQAEEPQSISCHHQVDSAATSAAVSKHGSHYDPLQKSPHVNSLTDQVGQLTKTIQSLKKEQDELSGNIESLREQQRVVSLSVRTQTEAKQQLTRSVWVLKEEKDGISRYLAGLKQEREQLTRTVCGLKDERDQLMRSMSSLKEEKEQLTKSLSGLERENGKLSESLSSGKEEKDQIMQSLQSLQTESDQLIPAVLYLKQERDELTNSLKCLKEQRDTEQSSYTLKADSDKLIKSVSSLREEKESIELSISCLQQEEAQIKLQLQGLKEERKSHKAALSNQTQTDGRNQKQHLLNPNSAVTTKKAEISAGATQRCQTGDDRGNHLQKQSDLMREIEAFGAELKKSRDELEKNHLDTKRLHSEFFQSEARREEVERKLMRLTDVANQMEETRKENDSLITQVKELQSKLTGLVRERNDALSLKAQIEEQHNIITAQLKAKTVALDELNSEYIALKRGQGSKDDPSTVLVSLRTRYNDIRAKYDALLKKRSQIDLDMAPLKAKLSCLVVKCQERNSLLLQMMKAMRKRGCVDVTLTQQVELLLSDAALQDYTAAFTPVSHVKPRDYSAEFTPGFISNFQDYTNGFIPDQTCSTTPPLIDQQNQNIFTPEPGVKYKALKREKHTFLVSTESTSSSCSKVSPGPTGTLKRKANSPVPAFLVLESVSVQPSPPPDVSALNESSIPTTAQLSPSTSGSVQVTSGPEKCGFHHPDVKGKSSPALTTSSPSSLSPSPLSSGTRVSLSRRLSSPEKIISLHEQLQKTLMSSYQVPASRGRGQQPRKSLSFSAPADLGTASQAEKQSFNIPPTNSLPVPTASSPVKHTPAVTTASASTHKSTALFNAVASRSANVTFSNNMFTNHHIKADSKTTSAPSHSSNFPVPAVAPSKSKSSSHTTTPQLIKKNTADMSDGKHTASTPLTLSTTNFDSDVTNPKTTASDKTAPSIPTAPEAHHVSMPSKTDGAAPVHGGLVYAASRTLSALCSPERSNKSAMKSTAALENPKTARPKPEAPAKVRCLQVIKTVGRSSLMIGWERPPLDELGCSNGTFVYGYRVFVDEDFHKSVMSSACTKCILENVDLSVPVHISVQTLGSNGLSSNGVHTTFRTQH